jgi:DNA repair ATPase RecN
MENEKLFNLMEKMYVELQGVRKEVVNNSDKIEIMDKRLQSVENGVIKIEQDHGKKLKALFDGYMQNSEQLNRIEKEVSIHEKVILRRTK